MNTSVWIIDGDRINREHLFLSFLEERFDVYVRCFENLLDASQCHLDADFIFIDLSAVDGRTLPSFSNGSYIGNLQRFVELHRSSFIIIMSALISHAEEDVEDLKEACPDSKLFVVNPCGRNDVDPLVAFVNKYSPERRNK